MLMMCGSCSVENAFKVGAAAVDSRPALPSPQATLPRPLSSGT